MKTLITGVSSRIGIALSAQLLAAGESVVGVDTRQPEGAPPRLDFLEADVRDSNVLNIAANGCDNGIHLAVNADQTRPTDIFETNVVGAYNFLTAAQNNDFSNSIVASSAPVHLNPDIVETARQLPSSTGPDHAYDLSKALQEAVARDFHHHGTPTMCLRFGHIVLGQRALNLDSPIPLADFDYCRGGWVALEDVVSACAGALSVSPSSERLEILSIVGSKSARKRFKIDLVERRLGFSFTYDFADFEAGSDS